MRSIDKLAPGTPDSRNLPFLRFEERATRCLGGKRKRRQRQIALNFYNHQTLTNVVSTNFTPINRGCSNDYASVIDLGKPTVRYERVSAPVCSSRMAATTKMCNNVKFRGKKRQGKIP